LQRKAVEKRDRAGKVEDYDSVFAPAKDRARKGPKDGDMRWEGIAGMNPNLHRTPKSQSKLPDGMDPQDQWLFCYTMSPRSLPQYFAPSLPANAHPDGHATKASDLVQTYAPAATIRLSWTCKLPDMCDQDLELTIHSSGRQQLEQRQSMAEEGLCWD